MAKQSRIGDEPSQDPSIPKLTSDFIKNALRKKHGEDYFQTEVKTGPTQSARPGELQIIDALAIKRSWANPCFMAYEVKVTRNDFVRDDKWGNYLNHCHKFSWACPTGLIQPSEVEDGCGLIWVNAEGECVTRKANIYRRIEIPNQMLMYIIMSKLEPDRHPFFGTKREYFEAYVQDRKDGLSIAHLVSRKWADEVFASAEKVRVAEKRVAQVEQDLTLGSHVLKVLVEHGVGVNYRWRSTEIDDKKLIERLAGSIPPGLLSDVQSAYRHLEHAIRLLKKPEVPR